MVNFILKTKHINTSKLYYRAMYSILLLTCGPKSSILTEILSLTKLKSGSSESSRGVGPDRGLCPYSSGSAFLVQFQQESCWVSLSKIPHSQHLITLAWFQQKFCQVRLANISHSPDVSAHQPPTLLLGYKPPLFLTVFRVEPNLSPLLQNLM